MKFKSFAFCFLIISFLLNLGCRGKEELDGSSDGLGGNGNAADDAAKPGAISSTSFSVTYQDDKKYTYFAHKGDGSSTDDWNQKCEVLPTATGADKDIKCVIEAHELDLYFFGIGIRVNVPPSMCSFLVQRRPYFYKYLPGTGNATAVDNTNGTATNSGVAAGANTLSCQYDYSASKGPNCCEGTYTKIVYSSTNVATSTPNQSWGGKAANCLAGPAIDLSPKAENGYPLGVLSFVEGVGFNEGYFVIAPITKNLLTNISAANYFKASEHTSGVPMPMRSTTTGFPATIAYHEFDCLDRAREKLASIKVMVREWNTVAELALKAAGDPDATGTEPVYGSPNNDYEDMRDLGEAYPLIAL